MPMASENPAPVVKTMYRPSVEFPNAVTYMLGLDMRRLSMRVYPGTSEPGGSATASRMEGELQRNLVAITNGLWKIRHAGKGGIIVQGEEVRELAPGLATLVVYKDGKVDILEWKEDMDLSKVQDAKQLKHLIVKDGKVVTTIKKRGEMVDSEIGVGSLLNENPAGDSCQEGRSEEQADLEHNLWRQLVHRHSQHVRDTGRREFGLCGRAAHRHQGPGKVPCAGRLRASHPRRLEPWQRPGEPLLHRRGWEHSQKGQVIRRSRPLHAAEVLGQDLS